MACNVLMASLEREELAVVVAGAHDVVSHDIHRSFGLEVFRVLHNRFLARKVICSGLEQKKKVWGGWLLCLPNPRGLLRSSVSPKIYNRFFVLLLRLMHALSISLPESLCSKYKHILVFC